MIASHLSAWLALGKHKEDIEGLGIADCFNQPHRSNPVYSIADLGIHLDYSKNLITDQTLALLVRLAMEAGLSRKIRQLFSGEIVNASEKLPALHCLLRSSEQTGLVLNSAYIGEIHATHAQMADICDRLQQGLWKGSSGEVITDVVQIGIGGSDLGPRLVCDALKDFRVKQPRIHFVANLDATELLDSLAGLSPSRTLFIIVSKSFATEETLINAKSARQWIMQGLGKDCKLGQHFIALSGDRRACAQFGVEENHYLHIPPGVGGRFSLWSAAGLSIALACGMETFIHLLRGAEAMDQHFLNRKPEQNMPIILAMLGIWYRNFLMANTRAVIPYCQRLQYLMPYIQQLEMESNGKSVNAMGQSLPYPTAAIVWGGVGSNTQHSIGQLLHQGSDCVPVDFIAIAKSNHDYDAHQRGLLANCLAQSRALLEGRDYARTHAELEDPKLAADEREVLARQQCFSGNRPSNTLIIDELNPGTLGALLSLHEHRTFVQGVVWGLNSFDQWGVELGKRISKEIVFSPQGQGNNDESSRQLLNKIRSLTQG